MADPSLNQGLPPATPTPESEAQQVLAGALGGNQQVSGTGQVPVAGPPQGVGASPASPPLTEKAVVNWNGATRELSQQELQQLVQSDIERGSVEQLREAQRAELQNLGSLQAVGQIIDRMTDAQRQQFQAVLQNPSLLDGSAQPVVPNGHPEPADELEMDMTRPLAPAPAAPQPDSDMQKMKEALRYLLQQRQQENNTRQRQTTEADVTAKLSSFSVFKNDPGALEKAREQVMDHLVANPNANEEQAVARAASYTQDLLQRHGGVNPGLVQTQQGVQPDQPWPGLQLDPAKVSRDMERGDTSTPEALYQQFLAGRRL